MLKRVMGKASFATLMDASGPRADGRIQLFISNDSIGKEAHDAFKRYDIGDILGVEGTSVSYTHLPTKHRQRIRCRHDGHLSRRLGTPCWPRPRLR